MRRLALAALALATSALPAPVLAQEAGDAVRQRDQLAARLERLRQEAAATEARQRALGDELVDISGDEALLRQRRDAAAGRVAELERRIAEDEVTLERMTDAQAELRADLAGKRRELATMLAALQRIGRQPPPALVGEADDATGTVRAAILVNAVLPELDAAAATLARDLAEAARREAAERERWASLRTDLGAVEEERGTLDALGGELDRRRALSTYERDRAGEELARLAEEEESVAALIERLGRDGPPVPPAASGFASRRGTLANPVAGSVVAEYGEPAEGGGVAQGRTIAALPDATVFAPMDGTVLFSAPFRGYGHVLILDAGEGYHLVLAGLSLASVAPGDRVTAGAPLGRMGQAARRSTVAAAGVRGSTLIGTRPALYVELRKDGAAIDSLGWWSRTVADGGRTGG